MFYSVFKVIGDINMMGDLLHKFGSHSLHFYNEDNVFSFFVTIEIMFPDLKLAVECVIFFKKYIVYFYF